MGLLSYGTPLTWNEIKRYSKQFKIQGAKQFIRQYHKSKDREGDKLLWGDEIEYVLVKFDDEHKTAKVLLKAESLFEELKEITDGKNDFLWSPELISFNIEGIPNTPYTDDGDEFVAIENNIKRRRKLVQQLLAKDEEITTITYFPRTGCENFTVPERKLDPKSNEMQSLFFPDGVIFSDHPKMKSILTNIHNRRGSNSIINIPVFRDENTQNPFQENFTMFEKEENAALYALTDHIYLDCSAMGLACSCIQVTMQCSDLKEAKYLFDQLVPLSPIMIALAAGAPIYKGYLSEYDSRWNVARQGADDRTKEELEANENKYKQIRSRWGSVECYLSESNKQYNLDNLYYNNDIYNMLLETGVDEGIAQHVAYLLIRDPLFMYRENLQMLDTDDFDDNTDIFDNFNSSNWLTVKLKLPISNDSKTGWRVEFRPMDAQLTDKESAAYSVFIVLLSRAILKYRLNFIMPILDVDRNIKKSYRRNAVLQECFHFRKNIFSDISEIDLKSSLSENDAGVACNTCREIYKQMSINDIINGIQGQTPGIISVVSKYVDEMTLDIKSRQIIQEYLAIIAARAAGNLKTGAKWMRDFVAAHPSYKKDSVVTEEINYDLLKKVSEMSKNDSTEMIFSHFA